MVVKVLFLSEYCKESAEPAEEGSDQPGVLLTIYEYRTRRLQYVSHVPPAPPPVTTPAWTQHVEAQKKRNKNNNKNMEAKALTE